MIIELIGFGLLILTIILIYNKLKKSTKPDPTKPDPTKPDDNNTCPLEYRPVNGVCNMKNFKLLKYKGICLQLSIILIVKTVKNVY